VNAQKEAFIKFTNVYFLKQSRFNVNITVNICKSSCWKRKIRSHYKIR